MRGPGVDRLTCAWLIRRFIDPQATVLWLTDPARAPRGAIGFDFDRARFTHGGSRVSSDVLLASFGLDGDAALQRIARIVHVLDAGGTPVSEAAGLESVLAGCANCIPTTTRTRCGRRHGLRCPGCRAGDQTMSLDTPEGAAPSLVAFTQAPRF